MYLCYANISDYPLPFQISIHCEDLAKGPPQRPPREAMPKCCGMMDPAGRDPRPCTFAADGAGGPSQILEARLGKRCPLCCPFALTRAMESPAGKGSLFKRLRAWRQRGSPVYEAAFTFGMPGLILETDQQSFLRRRAGEPPFFNYQRSWLHKRGARFHAFYNGKPIPDAPVLGSAAQSFIDDCAALGRTKRAPLMREFRADVREYMNCRKDALLPAKPKRIKQLRQKWWRTRRRLRRRLLAVCAEEPLSAPVVAWAMEEGIVEKVEITKGRAAT